PSRALLVALGADLLDLPIEVAHPLPDAAALDLDLLLAETAASPHAPSPAAHLAVVRVGADQTRQQVMESSRLHLQPSFVSARVLGEDLEDDLGPVEDPSLDLQLEVALLTRAPGRDHLTGPPTKSRRAAPRADQRLGSPVLGFRGDFRA